MGKTARRSPWSRRAILSIVLICSTGVPLGVGAALLPQGTVGASGIAVTNCNDSGAGSLRAAVAGSSAGSTITFSTSLGCNLIREITGSIVVSNNLMIEGPGASTLAVSGNNANSVFAVNDGFVVTISGLTIEDGNSDNGGGIDNDGTLTVTDTTVSHNTGNSGAGFGAGIFNDGTLTVTDSVISDNTEAFFGGGIDSDDGTSMSVTDSTVSGNQATNGGAGLISTGGTLLTVSHSTITGNTAAAGNGGGIINGATGSVINSTIVNNTAVVGAGIENDDGTLTVAASTIADNTDTGGPGGGIANPIGATSIESTILSNNDGNCSVPAGSITDHGYNISDDDFCDFTGTGSTNNSSLVGHNLGPLADNGGSTQTKALLNTPSADPMLNVVPAGPLCPATDQRGEPRVAPCDIGAYEAQPPSAPLAPSATPGSATVGLTWAAPASGGDLPITGYDIYCSTTNPPSTSGTPSATVSGASAVSGSVTGLINGTRYYCVVTAVSAIGQSVASTVVSVIPGSLQTGYDLAGSDGGVFVFPVGQASGFFGSLPGLGVKVNNIVGIVPTNNFTGYNLVGSDGGVFVFPTGQSSGFFGSVPGLGVKVSDIVGIVPTNNDQGYNLVGSDGGVFVFPVGQSAGFYGSLPSMNVNVSNIVGIVATPGGGGYFLVGKDGGVFTFGNAPFLGSLPSIGVSVNNITGIASTPDGKGYYVVGANGAVYAFGDATSFGSLPGLGVSVTDIVSIVPTPTGEGYWLIGSDGGVFALGDAISQGSLPGVGVHVSNVVGAVPTG